MYCFLNNATKYHMNFRRVNLLTMQCKKPFKPRRRNCFGRIKIKKKSNILVEKNDNSYVNINIYKLYFHNFKFEI